jgi:hypothetical protein
METITNFREVCLSYLTDGVNSIIITNLIDDSQAEFYSLLINKKEVKLVEKTEMKKTTFLYQFESNTFFFNDRAEPADFERNFIAKLHKIAEEVTTKKAFIYSDEPGGSK